MSSALNEGMAVQSDTLVSIYAAAVSPNGWNDVIDRCAADAGACGGAFLSFDVTDQASYSVSGMGKRLRDAIGQKPTILEEYLANIAPIEVASHQHVSNYSARRIWREFETWPEGAEKKSQLHYDWFLRTFGVGPKLMVRLNDHPRIREAFVLHFEENQLVTDYAIKSLGSQLPHLAKSAEMSVLYNTLQQRYAAVLAVLDKVDVGLCVLDRTGRVIASNNEAERIYQAGHGLSLDTNNYLQCKNTSIQAKLVSAISAAQIHTKGARAEALLAIRSSPVADPLLIEVSPLHDTLDELNYGLDGVLVQLVDSSSRAHCSVAAFAEAYELSPAEQAVTEFLLDGLSNREISEERGTGVDTVKSQIANVMRKANATSRVELVRSVLKVQPPIQSVDL